MGGKPIPDRAPPWRHWARPCHLAEARAHDGRRRNRDERRVKARCSQCAYRAAQSRVDGYDLNFSDDLLALDRELAD
jgi:hypothetical protein